MPTSPLPSRHSTPNSKHFALAFACALAFALAACGPAGEPPAQRQSTSNQNQSPSTAAGHAPANARACPMHCEPGKHYTDHDACPVCRMDLLALADIPYSVQLVPVPAARSASGPSGRFEMRVIDPTGAPSKDAATLSARAYVVASNLDTLRQVTLPERPAAVDLAGSPEGLCVLAGRLSADNRTFEPFLARFMNGKAAPTAADQSFKEDWDRVFVDESVEFRIRCNGEPYPAGREMPVRISLQHNAAPLPSDSIAPPETDLVFISVDLMTAVFARRVTDHADPLAVQARTLANGHNTDTIFGVLFPRPGLYRGFVTLRHEGRDHPFAFTFDVQPSGDAPAHDHDHHAHMGTTPADRAAPGR